VSIRDTAEHYFQTKTRAEVTAPPQQPLPVQFQYTPPTLQLPEINTTGLIIIGIVAIVGLIGLFALLGSNKKCER
jgi:Ni/Fe-hydrogenase subunit HybB-like protein